MGYMGKEIQLQLGIDPPLSVLNLSNKIFKHLVVCLLEQKIIQYTSLLSTIFS